MKMIRIAAAIIGTSFAAASYAHDKSVKEQLGSVKFPVSCTPEAQKKFNRAMALFHSFDWNRGKTAFEEIAQIDPKCGMAHWVGRWSLPTTRSPGRCR